MSIVTKTGDLGMTSLMYNRRVPKTDARVEAYGTVDELNACLGLARAASGDPWLSEQLLGLQNHLVVLMGELATQATDLERYSRDGYRRLDASHTAMVESLVHHVEAEIAREDRRGWAIPGSNPVSAALDLARTVCRRAERRVCSLGEASALCNPEVIVFVNRLADLLWLLARRQENPRA
jgi:cob(I)alamin adenosyltransferase